MQTKDLKVGRRVRVVRDINLDHHGIIQTGELGRVQRASNGEIDISLDRFHPGLTEYDNCIWITPDDDGTVLASLRRDWMGWARGAWEHLSIGACIILAFVLGDALDIGSRYGRDSLEEPPLAIVTQAEAATPRSGGSMPIGAVFEATLVSFDGTEVTYEFRKLGERRYRFVRTLRRANNN